MAKASGMKDPQQEGGGSTFVNIFVQSNHSFGANMLSGFMGGYPPHGPGLGCFPVPDGAAIDGATPAEAGR